MEAKILALEAQIRNLTLGGRCKNLSLATGIWEWSGKNNAKSVLHFLAQVDHCARVSNWSDEDKANIIKAKLMGSARLFVNGRDNLSAEVSYEQLIAALIERFISYLPDITTLCCMKQLRARMSRQHSFSTGVGY
jgi:hypothetical protein